MQTVQIILIGGALITAILSLMGRCPPAVPSILLSVSLALLVLR